MSLHAIPSPNIWDAPDAYEVENAGVDPDGVLPAAMRRLHDWSGLRVLDLGCGAGFHLPFFANTAASVVGVEPHPPLVERARDRVTAAGLANVEVRAGAAQDLPLPDRSVDVVHARWAYFFGPGCEPGLAELDRVVRPGGRAFVIDNDATRSTFGSWFARGFPSVDPVAVEAFWAARGWDRVRLDLAWTFDSRADLEEVVRIELPRAVADRALAAHQGLVVDYAVNLWTRAF